MNEIVYYRFGKRYHKIGRDETILRGAMKSYLNGELQPILSTDTVGDKPSSFSDEGNFYNPMDICICGEPIMEGDFGCPECMVDFDKTCDILDAAFQ